jgi:hypothetical protein
MADSKGGKHTNAAFESNTESISKLKDTRKMMDQSQNQSMSTKE